MPLLFRRKASAPPPRDDADDGESPPSGGRLSLQLNRKEIELYPIAVKMLWHYYDPADRGAAEAHPKEYPGPIDETVEDSVRELEKVSLLEIIPTFTDFSITARLTRTGLAVMERQSEPGKLAPTEIQDPATRAVTLYRAVDLG